VEILESQSGAVLGGYWHNPDKPAPDKERGQTRKKTGFEKASLQWVKRRN